MIGNTGKDFENLTLSSSNKSMVKLVSYTFRFLKYFFIGERIFAVDLAPFYLHYNNKCNHTLYEQYVWFLKLLSLRHIILLSLLYTFSNATGTKRHWQDNHQNTYFFYFRRFSGSERIDLIHLNKLGLKLLQWTLDEFYFNNYSSLSNWS